MIIIQPQQGIETIAAHRYCIKIYAKDRKSLDDFLKSNDFEVYGDPHQSKGVITINLWNKPSFIEYFPTETMKDYGPLKIENIWDFKLSDIFYEYFKKSRVNKIVYDRYSIQRASKVYELISDIEIYLRELAVGDSNIAGALVPRDSGWHWADHAIAQLDLTQVLNDLLLAPAADSSFLEAVKNSKNDQDLLKSRSLKKIDEIELSITEKDFKDFIKIRNAVMHFRVLAFKDCEKIVSFYEKIQQHKDISFLASYSGVTITEVRKRLSIINGEL